MTVNEKIAKIREMMQANGIDAVIVPSADPHMSEYFSDHWKTKSLAVRLYRFGRVPLLSQRVSQVCGLMVVIMFRQKNSLQEAKAFCSR